VHDGQVALGCGLGDSGCQQLAVPDPLCYQLTVCVVPCVCLSVCCLVCCLVRCLLPSCVRVSQLLLLWMMWLWALEHCITLFAGFGTRMESALCWTPPFAAFSAGRCAGHAVYRHHALQLRDTIWLIGFSSGRHTATVQYIAAVCQLRE
jgi:hypothetical protein